MAKQILSLNFQSLTYNRQPFIYEPPAPLGFLTFYTNASTRTFDPTFITSAGLLNWNLGDGFTINASNNLSHTYSQLGNKYVQIFNGTTTGPLSITSIDMNTDDLVGTLYIGSLSNLGTGGTTLYLNTNPKLTKLILPISTQPLSVIYINDCDITGILDMRSLTALGGQFNAQNNPHLTQILNPNTNSNFSMYWAPSCDLTGTLDMRPCSSLGGSFLVYANRHLTQILNPVNLKTFSIYDAFDCSLNGTLDVSGLTGLGGSFDVHGNINLAHIYNPVSSKIFTTYYAYNCNLTGTLDISGLTGLGGSFIVDHNSGLTQILNPNSSQGFANYDTFNCNLTGTLDVSGLTGLGGNFQVNDNINLTKILNPISSRIFSSYYAINCNLLGTLDLHTLTGLGGYIELYNNSGLTEILNPNSSQGLLYYWAFDCSLNGTLDVSGLINIGNNFQIQNNYTLQNLILPSTLNRQFTVFNTRNCSLNTISIDTALAKLHTLYDASAPIDNLIGNFDGTGNAWPTDGWNNVDVSGLYNAFNLAGKNVSININMQPGEIDMITMGDGIDFASVPAITGNQTINANMFIDSSLSKMTIWFKTISVNDYLLAVIGTIAETSSFGLTVQTRSYPANVRKYYNIDSYLNQIVTLEIAKTATAITSVKLNGSTLSPSTGYFDPSDTTEHNFSGTNHCSIWNLEIVGNNKWIGYPQGNTSGAWIDTVGSNNGTITGTPGVRNLF